MWPLLFTFFFLLLHFPAALLALPAEPKPETAALQPLVFPTSTPPSTIPAFPEQSDVAGTCPLDLPGELYQGVSRACPSSSAPPSRSRCCPTLAAWLYAAYSATALAAAARLPPPSASSSSSSSSSHPPSDMPLLPDDSETCVDGVEKALRSRGVALAPVNDTCDVAYCYCGVRLRPFTCPGGLALERDAAGRWVASGDAARRIERDCALPGAAGCSRCLRSLYQLKPAAHGGDGNSSGRGAKLGRDRDCQLLGLTWLLARNRTLYLPAATRVLRALILTPAGAARPLSCAVDDGMPLPVDLDNPTSAAPPTALPHLAALSSLLLLLLRLWWPLHGLLCFSPAGREP